VTRYLYTICARERFFETKTLPTTILSPLGGEQIRFSRNVFFTAPVGHENDAFSPTAVRIDYHPPGCPKTSVARCRRFDYCRRRGFHRFRILYGRPSRHSPPYGISIPPVQYRPSRTTFVYRRHRKRAGLPGKSTLTPRVLRGQRGLYRFNRARAEATDDNN